MPLIRKQMTIDSGNAKEWHPPHFLNICCLKYPLFDTVVHMESVIRSKVRSW